ncbi:hypothetical protein SAMN02927900_05895 [Rhizobium mongolense subsp. loessense]|uniref:Uncharacterized protein n=1 Tax=Rhizobium mongolense subsp. loessense TaxID=158890 RepID=A0A1G4U054_9HYPH|nr:hypothetical protein SAMN02927900_05895 [Rhizobium mongolense subsp. loessense]
MRRRPARIERWLCEPAQYIRKGNRSSPPQSRISFIAAPREHAVTILALFPLEGGYDDQPLERKSARLLSRTFVGDEELISQSSRTATGRHCRQRSERYWPGFVRQEWWQPESIWRSVEDSARTSFDRKPARSRIPLSMRDRWVRRAGARSSTSTMSAPARQCRCCPLRCFPRQRTLGSWQRLHRRAHREQRQAEQLPPLLMFRLWRSACSRVSQVRRLPGRTSPAGLHRFLELGLCRRTSAAQAM